MRRRWGFLKLRVYDDEQFRLVKPKMKTLHRDLRGGEDIAREQEALKDALVSSVGGAGCWISLSCYEEWCGCGGDALSGFLPCDAHINAAIDDEWTPDHWLVARGYWVDAPREELPSYVSPHQRYLVPVPGNVPAKRKKQRRWGLLGLRSYDSMSERLVRAEGVVRSVPLDKQLAKATLEKLRREYATREGWWLEEPTIQEWKCTCGDAANGDPPCERHYGKASSPSGMYEDMYDIAGVWMPASRELLPKQVSSRRQYVVPRVAIA